MKSLTESHSVPWRREWVIHQVCWRFEMPSQCCRTTKLLALMGFLLKSWRPERMTSFNVFMHSSSKYGTRRQYPLISEMHLLSSWLKRGTGQSVETTEVSLSFHQWKDCFPLSFQEAPSAIWRNSPWIPVWFPSCPWYIWHDLHSPTAIRKMQGTKTTTTHGLHWSDSSLWLCELPGPLENPVKVWMSRKVHQGSQTPARQYVSSGKRPVSNRDALLLPPCFQSSSLPSST